MKKVAKLAKKQGYRLTILIKIERIISHIIFDMKKVAKCAKKQGYRLTTMIKIERIISDMIFVLLDVTWKR